VIDDILIVAPSHQPNIGHDATRCRTVKTLPSTPYVFSSCYMASILKILLDFLRRLRFPTDYTKLCSGHWALFLAFICRRFGLWHLWHKKPRTFRKTGSPADPSFPSVGARGYTVLGISADFREHVMTASTVPTLASLPSLHERVPRQTTTATPSGVISPPALASSSLTADHPSSAYDGNRVGNHSSANLSTHSRASDRFSILTQSRESFRSPARQPSPLPRATYRQFGLGPRSSRSRERPLASRSPSPTNRSPPHHFPPRFELDTTNTHTPVAVVNPATSPTVPPSYTHEPSGPPIDHRNHRTQSSSGSVAVSVEAPSTESLPRTSSSPPPLTSESFAIGSPTAHSSSVSVTADIPEDLHLSPTASSLISDLDPPEGHLIAPIHPEEVLRYSKDIKMQVNYTVLLLHPYICWQKP
jgi:hypothetical protein